jgi:endogenous inhibitor of DNA gyrase (YacG/DUF329 family)
MSLLKCPVCGAAVDPSKTRSMPFCSERCRLIDLKRWLGEEYSVPDRASDPDEDGEAPAEGD